ncbi:MAG: site-specific DNA-methyltransferase [Acidobacteria bacterium]|nr:site-specific DNA-methyltransferase [Acidobacteriota bacterium]
MPKQTVTRNGARAPRNRTIALTAREEAALRKRLVRLSAQVPLKAVRDRTICQDAPAALQYLPDNSFDLLFADPPYNLSKAFNGRRFQSLTLEGYEEWLDRWLGQTVRLLKPDASVYICGDWRSSAAIHRAGSKYFQARNRITWEREKGRGARANWKNCSEDIWFFTVSDTYTFNTEAVMLKRRVLAPYTENGQPKKWQAEEAGRFRLTHPSNLWTDVTVPFWSMPENTSHPTQKPEKLLAKIILASTSAGDVILDPFAGSGTTAVVARKLQRHHVSIERDKHYCCLAEKRLEQAAREPAIQGYAGGVFWERNTFRQMKK